MEILELFLVLITAVLLSALLDKAMPPVAALVIGRFCREVATS